jgi:hypothetical protein
VTQLEAFLLQWFLCSSDQRANGEHCPTIDQDRVVAVLSLECEVLGVLPGELAIQSAAIRQLETQHSLLTNPGLDQPDTGQTGVKARGIHGVESKNAISTCTPAKTSDHVNQVSHGPLSEFRCHERVRRRDPTSIISSGTGSLQLNPETRQQLLIALTNQWASMSDQLDEGDFTPEDFYEIRKLDADDELVRESGCQSENELNKFIDDWFYSGFWSLP